MMYIPYTETDATIWTGRVGPWTQPMPTPRGRDVVKIFGDPKPYLDAEGKGHVDRNWARRNMVTAPLPVVGARCVHKLVLPFFVEALRRTTIIAPEYTIHVFGVFNPRLKKIKNAYADDENDWSRHTWGIACDVNPQQNPNRNALTTDLPPGFVWCWKSVGFQWGGDWHSSKDAMHLQACWE